MTSLNRNILSKTRFAPQTRCIADHLLEVGTISGVEAAAMFKTRSLTRRIADLRDAGAEITSEFKKDSTGQRYVRYTLS